MFSHTVRGPLKLLQDQLLSVNPSLDPKSVMDYVSCFCEKLHKAHNLAKSHLLTAQTKMKSGFDCKSLNCRFQPKDSVLVLLPIQNVPLHARFACPYSYDCMRKTRMCHINMLKAYIAQDKTLPMIPVLLLLSPLLLFAHLSTLLNRMA